MKYVMMLIVVLAGTRAVSGQAADDYRGGWRTDSGEAHVYEFSIRGTTVRGVYCTYCADATTLAFVDGTLVRSKGLSATPVRPERLAMRAPGTRTT